MIYLKAITALLFVIGCVAGIIIMLFDGLYESAGFLGFCALFLLEVYGETIDQAINDLNRRL